MNDLEYYNSFEERLQLELLKLCNSMEALDPVLAESEDITEKWNDYATPYMADAIEQVNDYPNASIAWPAFMGMAVAQWWDVDWLANQNNPYEKFYGVEGGDDMDDNIMVNILGFPLGSPEEVQIRDVTITCAEKAIAMIMKEDFEPGSEKAFYMLARTMKVMYKIGAALQLKRLGYKFQKVDLSRSGMKPLS